MLQQTHPDVNTFPHSPEPRLPFNPNGSEEVRNLEESLEEIKQNLTLTNIQLEEERNKNRQLSDLINSYLRKIA